MFLKPGQGCHFTWKNLANLFLTKNFWVCNNFIIIVVKFAFDTKIYCINKYGINKTFCHPKKSFLIKSNSNITQKYIFNGFDLFNTVSYPKINFKLNWHENVYFQKPWRNLENLEKN